MRAATRLCLVLCQSACFSEPGGNATAGEGSTSADGGSSGGATSGPTSTAPTSEDSTTSSGGTTNASTTTSSSEGSVTAVDSSSDGSETGEPCGPEARMIPPVPVGWDGVFALARPGPQGEPAMCPPPMLAGVEVVEGPASQCVCTCDPGCWVNGFDVAACDQEPIDFNNGFDGECVTFVPPDALHISLVFDDLGDDGGCDDPTEQPTLVADARYLECLHVSGEPCIPSPMEPGFLGPCIAYDGAVPCPDGPYSERHVVAEGAAAACENCSPCFEEALAACNGADAVVYPEANCGGLGVDVIDTTCSSELGRSVELDVALECPPATPLPVTMRGERTFCCVP
jgi:hypothetical protein